jgi:hypothetical protein
MVSEARRSLKRTATTSAAFLPLCQGGECRRAPRYACQRFRLNVAGRTARADDPDDEVTKSVVELLDVKEHAHERMLLTAG